MYLTEVISLGTWKVKHLNCALPSENIFDMVNNMVYKFARACPKQGM